MSSVVKVDKVVSVSAEGIQSKGTIPEDAEFFQDHFPAFPILPGVLALDLLKQTAESYLREDLKQDTLQFRLKEVKAVKFVQYLKPGAAWESDLKLVSREAKKSVWRGKLLSGGRPAVSARFELEQLD